MSDNNKAILEKANEAVSKGDNEGFLSFCTEDTEWAFVGEQTLKGKDAVRAYITKEYIEPPKIKVEHLISEGDLLTAVGQISMKDKHERWLIIRTAMFGGSVMANCTS